MNRLPISKIFRIRLVSGSLGRLNLLKWKKITIPITVINKTATKESKINITEIILRQAQYDPELIEGSYFYYI